MTTEIPTPTELREEWLHRLETEEDTRLKLLLSGDVDGRICFCALGIAADVLVQHGIGRWEDTGSTRDFAYPGDKHLRTFGLPNESGVHFGFDAKEWDELQGEVTALNDNGNASWPEIADHIREYVKEESN